MLAILGSQNSFLQVTELPDGLAVTVAERVHQICVELNLDLQKCCGLASDGALVMLGVRGRVSALLKERAVLHVKSLYCKSPCLSLW